MVVPPPSGVITVSEYVSKVEVPGMTVAVDWYAVPSGPNINRSGTPVTGWVILGAVLVGSMIATAVSYPSEPAS